MDISASTVHLLPYQSRPKALKFQGCEIAMILEHEVITHQTGHEKMGRTDCVCSKEKLL